MISSLWKGDNKRSWGQTIDKTTAKPVSVVNNNQEKPIIYNKAMPSFNFSVNLKFVTASYVIFSLYMVPA